MNPISSESTYSIPKDNPCISWNTIIRYHNSLMCRRTPGHRWWYPGPSHSYQTLPKEPLGTHLGGAHTLLSIDLGMALADIRDHCGVGSLLLPRRRDICRPRHPLPTTHSL